MSNNVLHISLWWKADKQKVSLEDIAVKKLTTICIYNVLVHESDLQIVQNWKDKDKSTLKYKKKENINNKTCCIKTSKSK